MVDLVVGATEELVHCCHWLDVAAGVVVMASGVFEVVELDEIHSCHWLTLVLTTATGVWMVVVFTALDDSSDFQLPQP